MTSSGLIKRHLNERFCFLHPLIGYLHPHSSCEKCKRPLYVLYLNPTFCLSPSPNFFQASRRK